MAESMTEPVKTFSVGFESDYFSEFDFAREVADSIGADHHEVVLKPQQLYSALPRLIWHEDEPIRNPSSVALFEVANLARSAVKVVLTGEGSDELFGGYERYWATLFNFKWGPRYNRVMPTWIQEKWIKPSLWQLPIPLSVKKKISHTFVNHSLRPEYIVFENWHSILPPPIQNKLLTPAVRQATRESDPYGSTLEIWDSRQSTSLLDRLLYTDQKTYLVELLQKQDTMSMAASIESRVPFLDHDFVQFAVQVPQRYKIRGTAGKYLVKRAMERVLPPSVIRRKKMGFPVPINQWFRGKSIECIRAILTSRRTQERGIFQTQFLARLIDEHVQGHRDHSDALWTSLNFELWNRVFIDRESHSELATEMTSGGLSAVTAN